MGHIARLALSGILAIVGASTASAQEPTGPAALTVVTVTLTNYTFTPAELILQRGTIYRLHFVNTSGKAHNFSAPALFSSSSIAPADQAKVEDGAVEVDSGASVDVQMTPSAPGSYEVECTHFMHAMLGMTGHAVVK